MGDDAKNDFVEFVQVWGGTFNQYLEAVILYDSRNGRFTVQVGYKIGETRDEKKRGLQIITTTGAIIRIERQNKEGKYTSKKKTITGKRTYLPKDK